MEVMQLIDLCQKIGKVSPSWTQGGGGNVSCKVFRDSNRPIMLIKASGWRLDAVTDTGGIAAVDLSSFLRRFSAIQSDSVDSEKSYSSCLTATRIDDLGELKKTPLPSDFTLGKPSMESGFHAVLPSRFVIHFHSLVSLIMFEQCSTERGKIEALARKCKLGKVAWINATMPGLMLSRCIADNPNAEVFILQNHGVILQSNDSDVLDRWADFEDQWAISNRLSSIGCKADQKKLLESSLNVVCPMRFYFPDTAVFYDRLRQCLIETESVDSEEPCFTFNPRKKTEKDMLEIWSATAALFEASPGCGQLPQSIIENVAGLPVELVRRGFTTTTH